MRRLIVAACLAGALLAVTHPALAKRAPDHVGVTQITRDEVDPSVSYSDRRINLRTGHTIALYRPSYQVPLGTPEKMARTYLSENLNTFGLERADLSDLYHHATRNAPQATVVRYRQHVNGVPVYKAELAVTLFGDRVVYVMNTYEPGLQVDTTPALTPEAAHAIAWSFASITGNVSHDETELIVYAKSGEQRLAYRIVTIPHDSPVGEWEIMVDAHTGEVFKAVDSAHYVDGTGNVFDEDPLSSAGVTYGTAGFVDGGDADTPQLDGELVSKPMLDIDFNGLAYELGGPYAQIVDTESPFFGLFTQATSDFSSTRSPSLFEATNTYFFVDNVMRYINETLAVPVVPFQYAGGARFDPHGLGGADNSHYSGGSGVIAFGEGGVDDAEDSDVVIHELGHALHDWVTNGSLSQVNGLSEGTGDYVAASYSRSKGHWTPGDAQYYWVFNWDGHNPFWGGRRTNWPNTYPGGLTGQIHTDGQIWSTCLMRIWDIIGRDQIDRAVWVGLSMTNSGTGQQDAANAVVQAALNMGYPDADITAMVTEMEITGYNITVIGVEEDASSAIAAVRLLGASPNPFNPTTRISYELVRDGHVRLDVFNAAGQQVGVLVDGMRTSGAHSVPFDAAGLGSGVYFYRMTTDGFSDMQKMTLLK